MTSAAAPDSLTQALPLKLFSDLRDRRHAQQMQDQLELIEAGLMASLSFASPVADAPARYLAEAGGKRIRPMLTVLASELGDGPNDQVRKAAQTVEMTHLATLYHDDVMDEATLRRGVPAAQLAWSNSVAILAGDLLFARASTLVAGMGEEALLLQARTFERLCLGQLHETVGPQPGDDAIEHYIQVLADKTGSLIACAARMGAMFGNVPADAADAVMEYGERIGVAFQLIDDVIDLSPKKESTGKLAGTDLRAGVATLPMLLLRERVAQAQRDGQPDTAAETLLARIDAGAAAIAAGADPRSLDAEVAALREHDVTRETEATARRWAADAVRALDVLPKSPVKRALERFAQSVVERDG